MRYLHYPPPARVRGSLWKRQAKRVSEPEVMDAFREAVFQQGSCTRGSPAAVMVCIRPVQAQTRQIPSWRGELGTNLTLPEEILAIDSFCERENQFNLRVRPLEGQP